MRGVQQTSMDVHRMLKSVAARLVMPICLRVQAAELALQALEAVDVEAAKAAEATAAAAHARSNIAMEANSKAYKLAKQYEHQEAKQQKTQQPAAGAPALAAGAAGASAAAEQTAAPAAGQPSPQPVAAAAAAVPEDEGAAAELDDLYDADAPTVAATDADGDTEMASAAADFADLAYKPSWARGGGGRGRAGGRFRGIDPIYPVEDPKILQVCGRQGLQQPELQGAHICWATMYGGAADAYSALYGMNWHVMECTVAFSNSL